MYSISILLANSSSFHFLNFHRYNLFLKKFIFLETKRNETRIRERKLVEPTITGYYSFSEKDRLDTLL